MSQTAHQNATQPYDELPVTKQALSIGRRLSNEGLRARNNIVRSLIPPAGRRAASIFLETEDYAKVSYTRTPLVGNLFMEALPRFVESLGGEIVLSCWLDEKPASLLNPVEESVKVDGAVRRFVVAGYQFIRLEDIRVVVLVCQQQLPWGTKCEISVGSSSDADRFFREWERFTRESSYLRGRAFFVDGEIIERKRTYSWDDILLTEEVRQTVQTHVGKFLRNRTGLRSLGVKQRRGLLLEGPPGTGKTLLGRILADTLDCSFIWVMPRHVENAASFNQILYLARFVAPTVLFLEDLDLFAEDRHTRGWTGLGELMNQLDGAPDNEDIITIATTNQVEVVEKALRNRPGRFDRIVHFGAMDEACRARMLGRLLSKASVSADDMSLLVGATEEYTGAQLEELTNTIYILAYDGGEGEVPGEMPQVAVTRTVIDEALSEVRTERRMKAGFHSE